MAVPLSIISGFLGAGKTSAIRAQLEQRRNEKLAIIVNDFGEAALDEAALAEGEPFRITNIPGACVCCTAPEGFVDALGAVLEGGPDRILIEPTGLARPQDLVDTVRRSPHGDRIELGPVIVLVDPAQLAATPEPVFAEQIEAADVLVANRIDLADDDQLARFERFAGELWPPPLAVHRTRYGRLADEALDWPAGEGTRLPRAAGREHTHGAPSTEGFATRSLRWPPRVVFSKSRLGEVLERLVAGSGGVSLARFKGVFRTQEGVYRLEVAGGKVDERLTSFRRDSRVDLIVRSVDDDPLDRAADWLEAAVLSERELRLSGERIEVVLEDGRVHLVDRELLLGLPEPMPDVSELFPKRSGAAARLRSLWRELGLPDAGHVVIVAGDGFATEPVPVPTLCEGVLLHSLAGSALRADQGGPFRLLIPEEANPPSGACANVKGVAKLVHRGAA